MKRSECICTAQNVGEGGVLQIQVFSLTDME